MDRTNLSKLVKTPLYLLSSSTEFESILIRSDGENNKLFKHTQATTREGVSVTRIEGKSDPSHSAVRSDVSLTLSWSLAEVKTDVPADYKCKLFRYDTVFFSFLEKYPNVVSPCIYLYEAGRGCTDINLRYKYYKVLPNLNTFTVFLLLLQKRIK